MSLLDDFTMRPARRDPLREINPALADGRDEVGQWCIRPDEHRVVFTTASGSTYVAQCIPATIVLRQLEGDSLERLGFGPFPQIDRAWSDVASRASRFVLRAYSTEESGRLTTSRVTGSVTV